MCFFGVVIVVFLFLLLCFVPTLLLLLLQLWWWWWWSLFCLLLLYFDSSLGLCFLVLCDSQEPHANGRGMSHRTIGIGGKESEKPRNTHINMIKCHVRRGRRWKGALPSHFFSALFSSRCAAPPKGYCWSSSISSSMPLSLSLSSPLYYESILCLPLPACMPALSFSPSLSYL